MENWMEKLCINTCTLGEAPLKDKIELLSKHGISKIALWENDLTGQHIEDVKKLLEVNKIVPVLFSFLGPFNQVQTEDRDVQLEKDIKKIELANYLGIKTMLALSGAKIDCRKLSKAEAYCNLKDNLVRLSEVCSGYGMRIAFEPIHYMYQDDWTFMCTIEESFRMITEMNKMNIGLMLDLYHIWMEPDLQKKIKMAEGQIFGVQLSDWKPLTLSKYDRGLPGEGCIPLADLLRIITSSGWNEWYDIEIFSNELWEKPPEEIALLCKDSFSLLENSFNNL